MICLLAFVSPTLSGCLSSSTPAPGAVAESGAAATNPDGDTPEMLTVTSSSFSDSGSIPNAYCAIGVDGASNISPQLSWSAPPEGTRSMIVTIIDHHPIARMWVHWVVVDIPPSVTSLAEDASGSLATPILELKNTTGRAGYGGPKPPIGSGDHDYVVTVYALDIEAPSLPKEPTAADIALAVDRHTLAMGSITGVFGR